MLGSWIRDVRYGARNLVRQPLFLVVAAGSLALGIGANTAVFSVANALLLRPLPGMANYDRAVELGRARRGSGFDTFTWPDFVDIREQTPALAEAAGYSFAILSVAQGGEGIRATGYVVTPSYFSVVGAAPPELGRYLAPDEATGFGEHPVTVVSNRFWRERLGADPDIVGTTLRLNRNPYTVVGVASNDFRGHIIGVEPDVFIPMTQFPAIGGEPVEDFSSRRASWMMAVGLLSPGATLDDLRGQLETVGARLAEAYPESNATRSFRAVPLGPIPGGGRTGIRLFVTALLGMVALILLVTCTNVAGMFLARGTAREREVAVRLALGAGRGRLIQQLTVETLLVFLIGGGLGIALGIWAVGLVRPDMLPVPITIRFDISPDYRVIGFATAVTLLTGLIFGLLPASRATRMDVAESMKEEGRGGGRRTGKMRLVFAGAQVGLSLVLLVTAGLFVRSLQRAGEIDSGFDPSGAYTTLLDLSLEGYDDDSGRQFQREMLAAFRGEEWVRAASVSTDLPLDLSSSGTIVTPEGWEATEDNPGLGTDFNRVGAGYFEALSIPLLRGRPILGTDRDGERPVVVVSDRFAEEAWPGESPLGRTVALGLGGDARKAEVVGVVADVKNQLITDAPKPFMYLPIEQAYAPNFELVIRTALPASEAIPMIRRRILDLDGSLSMGPIVSLERYTSVGVLPQRIAAGLTTGLGLLALLLSGLGIYGVVSFAVGQQRREIGIRMALGADRGVVLRRFLGSGIALALPGMVIGAGLAVFVGGLLRTLLLDLSPYDPVALGSVSSLLLAVVLLATFIPARRAAGVDPAESLRSE